MIPRLQYDIEGFGQAPNGTLSKPDLPGYVTTEKCDAKLAQANTKAVVWAVGGGVLGAAVVGLAIMLAGSASGR